MLAAHLTATQQARAYVITDLIIQNTFPARCIQALEAIDKVLPRIECHVRLTDLGYSRPRHCLDAYTKDFVYQGDYSPRSIAAFVDGVVSGKG